MRFFILLGASMLVLMGADEYSDQAWGAGAVGRVASIPYADEAVEDEDVSNFVPLLFYENEHIYLHGLTYGIKLYDIDNLHFSALSRVRFLDIPEVYQNRVQGDTIDYGLRGRYFIQKNQYFDIEIMENNDHNSHLNLTYSSNLAYNDLFLEPSITARLKDEQFNTQYYGLDRETIKADADLSVGIDLKYHIYSNLYFLAGAKATILGANVQKSAVTDEDYAYNVTAGIGILNSKNRPFFDVDEMKPYLRLAHGWATPSNIGEVLAGDTVTDVHNNQLTSIFYGHPVSKTLFNQPIEVYLTPGLVFHHHSHVQESLQEADLAFKCYYTLPIPKVDLRLGLAEGFSYVSRPTYIEAVEMEQKGYYNSKTMLYLDASADLNLGAFDETLDSLWIGTAIQHRSSVFEESSLFGRIKGGSNYNTIYLQWHF